MSDANFPSDTSSTGSGPTTVEIRGIHPLQAGKLLACLYAVLGVVFVPFFVIAAMLRGGDAIAGAIGICAAMLIFYPLMGFVGGALMAFAYNAIAKAIGGFRMDLR